ncbi:hypothetical protein [Streptomyces sp. NPDC046727]|uniref:hypothetical protein n=1 Tax=Streptomyces sp. NPDC046727 TaxID=3155373 RepID=UPI0033E46CFC
MSNSTMSCTPPARQTRRRRPAGEVVLGVDTHRDAHVAAVLSVMGTVLATGEFPATAAGYRHLLEWAQEVGSREAGRVEGAGSYGASLSRARTQAINQLKSVLITADPALREERTGLGNA